MLAIGQGAPGVMIRAVAVDADVGVCPYLGLIFERDESRDYASLENRCYAQGTSRVGLRYQDDYCLSSFEVCRAYASAERDALRSPVWFNVLLLVGLPVIAFSLALGLRLLNVV